MSNLEVSFLDSSNINNLEFSIKNIKLALANAIRRCLLSELPIVGFNDKWHDEENMRNILIKKNTSVVHNEFLSHRISLIPLCMYKYEELQNIIISRYDSESCKRVYELDSDKNKLSFSLVISSSEEDRLHINLQLQERKEQLEKMNFEKNLESSDKSQYEKNIEMIEYLNSLTDKFHITDNLITIHHKDGREINKEDIFIKDVFSDDYNLLFFFNESDVLQELNIEMKLTVNNGFYHSSYCPVGTVSMQFVEDDENINYVFKEKILYKNNERTTKGLPPYVTNIQLLDQIDDILTNPESFKNDDEVNNRDIDFIVKEKKSFDLLDKERVFKINDDNEPNEFKFTIESLGQLPSNVLLYNSLNILKLKLNDIIRNISITDKVTLTDKIEYQVNTNLEWVICVNDENHTLGNLINDYMKRHKDLSFSGYKMPHPLKQQIEFYMTLKPKKNFEEYYKKNYVKNTDLSIEISEEEMDKNIKFCIFRNTIENIIQDIDRFSDICKETFGDEVYHYINIID